MKQTIYSIVLGLLLLSPSIGQSAISERDRIELGTEKNLAVNGNCQSGKAGWSTYADAAASSPADGTGGSPNVTIAATTSSPIEGSGSTSCLLTKDAANRQGQGWAYSFTAPRASTPHVVTIDYAIASGTYDAGSDTTDPDITVWVYGPTDGTAVLTQLAPYKVLGATAGLVQRFQGRLQTASSGTAYRLILHEAKTGTSAYTVKVNARISVESKTYGPSVTDEVAYTPTLSASWGAAPTNVSFWWKREGDRLHVRGSFTTQTTTAAIGSISIPSGLTIDGTKIPLTNTTGSSGMQVGLFGGAGNGGQAYIVTALGTSNTLVYLGGEIVGTANSLLPVNVSSVQGSSLLSTVNFTVPITGWSSNVQVSSDADTRVVAMHANLTNVTTGIASGTVVFNVVDFDTHGAYNNATGIYTVPVPGVYRASAKTFASSLDGATDASLTLDKNGTAFEQGFGGRPASATSTQASISVTGTVKCVAGDQLRVTVNGDASFDLSNSGTRTTFQLERLSGPAQIAASETVSARYGATATTFTNNSAVTITHTSKDHDTHNAYSAGTYTIPSAGKYFVQLSISTDAFAAGGATNVIQAIIQKNGSDFAYGNNRAWTTSSTGHAAYVTTTINCIAGDTIRFQGFHTLGATPTLTNTATDNYFSIYRIGN